MIRLRCPKRLRQYCCLSYHYRDSEKGISCQLVSAYAYNGTWTQHTVAGHRIPVRFARKNGGFLPPQKSITARASYCSDRDCDFAPENKLNTSIPLNDHPRDQKVPCLFIPVIGVVFFWHYALISWRFRVSIVCEQVFFLYALQPKYQGKELSAPAALLLELLSLQPQVAQSEKNAITAW